MNTTKTTRGPRATLLVPCTMILQLAAACAETTLDTGGERVALPPDFGDSETQLAEWPMPDAVSGSKAKPRYRASDIQPIVVDDVTVSGPAIVSAGATSAYVRCVH